MDEKGRRPFRRDVLRAVGCCGAAALGLTRLVGAQPLVPSARDTRRNAWAASQKAVGDASGMADRIASTLDTLTSLAASAAGTKEKLQAELRKLADEIASLSANKDRLLEEFRNGLFCSGCNKTKSEILAKGETFPHPGQQVVKPTPAQIAAKERELQAPIDRAERATVNGKKQFKETSEKEDLAFAQIRAGVALWRTAVTYWRGAVHNGVRERDIELKSAVQEFQKALDAELKRQARKAGKVSDADVQAEADIWRRLLDKQKTEIDSFRVEAQKTSIEVFERTGAQKTAINGYLQKAPLPKTLLAVVVVDAPVSPGRSAGELGVNYHLGQLSAFARADSAMPPPLPAVASFVNDFKSASYPEAQGAPARVPNAPAQQPASDLAAAPRPASSKNSRLLDALP